MHIAFTLKSLAGYVNGHVQFVTSAKVAALFPYNSSLEGDKRCIAPKEGVHATAVLYSPEKYQVLR